MINENVFHAAAADSAQGIKLRQTSATQHLHLCRAQSPLETASKIHTDKAVQQFAALPFVCKAGGLGCCMTNYIYLTIDCMPVGSISFWEQDRHLIWLAVDYIKVPFPMTRAFIFWAAGWDAGEPRILFIIRLLPSRNTGLILKVNTIFEV